MRVLILGEDAPGGLMGSYERGFTELGIETQTFCLARAYESSVPAIRSRALRRVAEPVVLSAFNEKVARDLTGVEFDLVLVIKGHRQAPPRFTGSGNPLERRSSTSIRTTRFRKNARIDWPTGLTCSRRTMPALRLPVT